MLAGMLSCTSHNDGCLISICFDNGDVRNFRSIPGESHSCSKAVQVRNIRSRIPIRCQVLIREAVPVNADFDRAPCFECSDTKAWKLLEEFTYIDAIVLFGSFTHSFIIFSLMGLRQNGNFG